MLWVALSCSEKKSLRLAFVRNMQFRVKCRRCKGKLHRVRYFLVDGVDACAGVATWFGFDRPFLSEKRLAAWKCLCEREDRPTALRT